MTTHSFIAYRDDYPDEPQPIAFSGDAWRRYIPLACLGPYASATGCLPGFAAILVNRAHTYADLALPIDAAEERFYLAIDGSRSNEEICREVAGAGDEEPARKLFQRLWENDQIVFDATGR